MWWDVDEERRNLDPGCVFCKIISGELPSREVHSDDRVVAFRDSNPMAKVHVLVVPRAHVTNLVDATPDADGLLGHLLRTAAEVAQKMGIAETGYRLAMNQGVNAGQLVDHLHLHVLGGQKLYPLGELATGTEG